MRPRTHYGNSLRSVIHVSIATIVVLLFAAPVSTSAKTSSIIARDSLSTKHRMELSTKLRAITGWTDLRFDDEGFLQISGEEFMSGSHAARELVKLAIEGKNIIVIEDASSRSDVAFCRVVPGRWVGPSARREPVFVVLVDFTDFEQITGDAKARAAFDVGWGFLHELDHVINDSEDPRSASGSAGDCEDHINQMRNEVGLPLRAGYFFSPFPVRTDPNFRTRLVRLSFIEKKNASTKGKRYWLVWDAALVGGSTEQWQTALVSPSH